MILRASLAEQHPDEPEEMLCAILDEALGLRRARKYERRLREHAKKKPRQA